ncbi:MAG: ROK family protein [Chitinispirillaceae bacterium]|nr:ROK family protein [Chitinispirillaceae bacterium]
MEKSAIGIDLGGTNLKGVVMGKDGRGRHLTRTPSEADRGGGQVLRNILSLIEKLLAQEGPAGTIVGIGIGTPGFVSLDGVISGAENLPGWKGTQLYKPVRERFGMNVVAANDVTVMALAEARYGAGRGVANMVCYALGTGIGGGIVIDHKLYAGTHGMAGELGHIPVEPGGIPCNCGQTGCVERYASATGIVNMAKELAERAEVSPFVKIVRADPSAITSKTVYEFVAKGDAVACAVHERACEMLARAVGITISALSPDRVVLGGGVMMAGQVIIDTVKRYLPRYTMREMLEKCDIVAAELGEDAGVIGAAAMALDKFYE